jgi:hypothetical protein
VLEREKLDSHTDQRKAVYVSYQCLKKQQRVVVPKMSERIERNMSDFFILASVIVIISKHHSHRASTNIF